LAGWLNRHQQDVIGYLIEENRVLKEQLEGQRLRFTDEQRMRLAVKAKVLGRRLLDELETPVTPEKRPESKDSVFCTIRVRQDTTYHVTSWPNVSLRCQV
jgi:hypothetical protein